jgi:bifunctional UDP-N-acetylglucosamine pyrophosphorylase/glucosamine-1-phosphate N-acetyltransferase
MKDLVAIVLAAGKGERMKSGLPKVLHEVCGRPIISYVLDSLRQINIRTTFVVVGYKKERLIPHLGRAGIVIQKKPLGTADAVGAAKTKLRNFKGTLLVIAGDAPLIRGATLKELIAAHRGSGSVATVLTAKMDNPSGYGRVVRDRSNRVIKICEETDLDERSRQIKEINSGIYCFESDRLFAGLNKIKLNSRKKECYLTDIIAIMAERREKISTFMVKDSSEAMGINTRRGLARANGILKDKFMDKLMESGVTVVDPRTTYIEMPVDIGQDTIIFPFTMIEKNVIIGKNCRIGPFCHLREGSIIQDDVELGNFVELVRSRIGEASKAKHLSYLGDTIVGENVNIGAGTIVANFDGKKKNKTVIEDGAFIGSGSILIAPVKVGKKATTGAGAVVTPNHNVPAGKTVVGLPARLLEKR